jgi:putative tricarboxylic transport membrane protein
MSRDGAKFGTGMVEGVVAPGDRGARRRHLGAPADAHARRAGLAHRRGAAGRAAHLGPAAGPLLFVEKPDFVWGLIASMYLGNIVGLVVVLTCVPLFAAILRVPFSIIAPVILVICAIGAYTVHNSMFDVWLMLVFGVMGYVFKKLDYPLAPLVLALVLGDRAEDSFRQSMLMSQGDTQIFFANALSGPSRACRSCCSSGRDLEGHRRDPRAAGSRRRQGVAP